MSETNMFDYTEIHQDLMENLQDAIDKLLAANESVAEARNDLVDHNTDGTAHPDIRTMIQESAGTSSSAVDERISQHNTSTTSHPDIRTLIEEVRNDTSAASALITKLVSEHNLDKAAHADIREAINAINTQLGGLNLTEVNQQLQEVVAQIQGDINTAITELQNVDARHDSEIQANRTSINKLEQRIVNITNDITILANSNVSHRDELDQLLLRTHNIEREEHLGLEQWDENGPNLVDFTCTLPTYVNNSQEVKFYFTGATGHEEANELTLEITQGLGDYSIGKLTGIALDEELTMTVGTTNTPGQILDFLVGITDTVTSVTSYRVFSVMIARPLSEGNISLPGLLDLGGVEPGQVIDFQVSNLLDDGSGRYTYELNAEQSGITFTPKTVGITEDDELQAKIPDEAVRDSDLHFTLTVVDSLGSRTEIKAYVHVNPLPTLDDFTHNIPAKVIPNREYAIKFSGVTSAQGNNATYSVSCADEGITFSKASGILTNENVQMQIGATAVRGKDYTITITSLDENGIELTTTATVHVNMLPTADSIAATLEDTYRGGQTLTFKINGGEDPDGGTRSVASYTIDPGSSSFVFSKTSGIIADEDITVTLPKVADDSLRTFVINAIDDMGETSAEGHTVEITVTPIYVASAPRITAPLNSATLKYEDGVTVNITPFEYTIDVATDDQSE